ncbi:MAG: arginase [Fimbriimonas sp.]
MISIIGAPFDLCGMRLGSRLGPAAIRLAHLGEVIGDMGLEYRDLGDAVAFPEEAPTDGLRNFGPLLATAIGLRDLVEVELRRGSIPLVMGGEHTLSAGSVAAALRVFDGDLAVLWIDAHADMNTPGSSETGNIHGMPLAALIGYTSETEGEKDKDWNRMLEMVGPQKLKPEHTAWFGLRDVDPAERTRLQGPAITMHEIDRHGMVACVQQLDQWLRAIPARNLWISFDVDALDPILAPGTGTAVRGGLSYRESHLLAELLHEMLAASDFPAKLVGVDVVEVNPLYDTNNQTAKMTVEWVASLFGKTILG